jgi:RES domain-containing protein
MQLWRLYRRAHGPGLDGTGGLHAPGRWHRQGTRVVYFGASPAIVVLEKLAHLDPATLPSDLILARFEANVSLEEEEIDGGADALADLQRTQARGDAFFRKNAACLLRVRSVILPEEYNLVLNPLHPDAAKVTASGERTFRFDGRLLF